MSEEKVLFKVDEVFEQYKEALLQRRVNPDGMAGRIRALTLESILKLHGYEPVEEQKPELVLEIQK